MGRPNRRRSVQPSSGLLRPEGARFFTNCAVEKIELQNGHIAGVQTEQGYIRTSMAVCAAGAWSSRLLRSLGVRLPSLLIVDATPSIDLSALRLSRFKKGRKTKASPVV
jgi:glycine/D-amino acid oxidase-like deaminating enzyme